MHISYHGGKHQHYGDGAVEHIELADVGFQQRHCGCNGQNRAFGASGTDGLEQQPDEQCRSGNDDAVDGLYSQRRMVRLNDKAGQHSRQPSWRGEHRANDIPLRDKELYLLLPLQRSCSKPQQDAPHSGESHEPEQRILPLLNQIHNEISKIEVNTM